MAEGRSRSSWGGSRTTAVVVLVYSETGSLKLGPLRVLMLRDEEVGLRPKRSTASLGREKTGVDCYDAKRVTRGFTTGLLLVAM